MVGVFGPLEFLLVCLAGWLNQRERTINEYLRAENQILREQLGKKRPRLTDDQRRRLAALGKSSCSRASRCETASVNCSSRSARVLLPWAMMEKLRMGTERRRMVG